MTDQAISWAPTPFVGMRTALLPADVLLRWADGATGWGASSDTSELAVTRDRALLVTRLKEIVSRPDVREALYVASSSTHAGLLAAETANGPLPDKLARALVRYVQRMAGRATPFGLFAGCSVLQVGPNLDLRLPAVAEYRRYCRLDNDYLHRLTASLRRREEVRRTVRYRPNSSLYKLGGRWRYVQTVVTELSRRHVLVALESDEYLDAALVYASTGTTLGGLSQYIQSMAPDGDIPSAEANAYVETLVDHDVLVSDLVPLVTGREAFDDVIAQLADIEGLEGVTAVLDDARRCLAEVCSIPLGTAVDAYQHIERLLNPVATVTDAGESLQVDMIKPCRQATCSVAVIEEVAQGIALLQRLTPPSVLQALNRFREDFATRYERAEVRLVDALDEESGIGFDRGQNTGVDHAPLVDGLAFYEKTDGSRRWERRDAHLLKLLERALRQNVTEIALTAGDLEQLASTSARPSPNALAAMAVVASTPDRESPEFRVWIRSVHGPSAVSFFGRFCHADAELARHVAQLVTAEEALAPEAVFAEIVHIPEARLGNILARPVLRSHEIVYLGRSGAPVANQIPVSDLLVSVEGERIVLRSERLGTEVIPRLTSMHNFVRGQPIYRFLCHLQNQRHGLPYWSWGPFESASFLPRLTCGRLVLCRAQWRLDRPASRFGQGPLHVQVAGLQQWRREVHAPRFVVLVDRDNDLLVDLENALSIETFLHLVRKREECVVAEMFPDPAMLTAHGPEGRFVSEIVVPLVAQSAVREPTIRNTPTAAAIRRSFPPGSGWLYLKWYAGTSNVDRILSTVVAPAVRAHADRGGLHRWFFVRYGDPHWHLRLRCHGDPDYLRSELLPALTAATQEMLEQQIVWKMQLDTYEREVERYGGAAGMLVSESWFWRDSEFALDVLSLSLGDAGLDTRWRVCLRIFDLILSRCGFSLDAKLAMTRVARAASGARLNVGKSHDRLLGIRFRKERSALEALLRGGGRPEIDGQTPLSDLLLTYSHDLIPLVDQLLSATRERPSMSLASLAMDYLHMHANRLLRSLHRSQEFVLHDFLVRLYESEIGRARGSAKKRTTRQVETVVSTTI